MGQFRLFLSTTINRWMRHCLHMSNAAPSFVSVEISWTRFWASKAPNTRFSDSWRSKPMPTRSFA